MTATHNETLLAVYRVVLDHGYDLEAAMHTAAVRACQTVAQLRLARAGAFELRKAMDDYDKAVADYDAVRTALQGIEKHADAIAGI